MVLLTKPTKGQKKLTDDQKQEIKEAFDLFDTDGSVGPKVGIEKYSLEKFNLADFNRNFARILGHDGHLLYTV
jgi:Ca2+-binding EF-hand superfamily protein